MSLTLKIEAAKPFRWLASAFTGFPSRRSLAQWLNGQGLTGSFAEVGCNDGAFAKQVLAAWEGACYIMIDPWQEQSEEVFREFQGYQYQHCYKLCQEMAKDDDRIVIYRKFSSDAARLVDDCSLDCCYLDGNHAYEAVMEDLNLWWPKVKYGGLFGGHDYYNHTKSGHWCEVKKALDEWTKKMGLKFFVSPCTSWWIMKTYETSTPHIT